MNKIGIIGGTGIMGLEPGEYLKLKKIKTSAGAVEAWEGKNIVFINRHGRDYRSPHEINYQANMAALKKLKANKIIAIAAVGSINPAMKPGDFVLLSDFIDFTRGRKEYFDPARFTDVSFPYAERIKKELLRAVNKLKVKIHPRAIYACAEGPRFESKAEIKMYRLAGADVVGMTQVPEVVLAAELGIPYAVLGLVTNFAAGMTKKKVTAEEVSFVSANKRPLINLILTQTIKQLLKD